MERNPACDLITQQAIALGQGWKNELEKSAIISNNELKMSLVTLAQSQTTTNDALRDLASTVKADHEIVAESQRQWREMQEWQKQESIRHDKEEQEKKEALVKVEAAREKTAIALDQERKDRIKPFWDTFWTVVKWAAVLVAGGILTAVYETYFK